MTEADRAQPDEPTERAERPRRRVGSFTRELAFLITAALVVSVLLRVFLVQAFFIPSTSMQPTLEVDDRLLVSKLTPRLFDLRRGEVVVFRDPGGWLPPLAEPATSVGRGLRTVFTFLGLRPADSGEDLVKRVIGLPGDEVRCCDPQGRVSVNGVPLDETAYLFPGDRPSETPFDVRVPRGRLWVMGDHRSMSGDSREHLGDPGGGMVPIGSVVGRAFVVVWPVDHLGRLRVPQTFDRPGLAAARAP